MESFTAALLYLAGSLAILLLSILWVMALLEITSQRHKGVFRPAVLLVLAITISVLAAIVFVTVGAVMIDRYDHSRHVADVPWGDRGLPQ